MTWSRASERPLLHVVAWTWDMGASPHKIVLAVESVPVVRETKCRWYLAHPTRRVTWAGLHRKHFIEKNHSGCLFIASMDKAAALRRFARHERAEADHYAALAKNLYAVAAQAERDATHAEPRP